MTGRGRLSPPDLSSQHEWRTTMRNLLKTDRQARPTGARVLPLLLAAALGFAATGTSFAAGGNGGNGGSGGSGGGSSSGDMTTCKKGQIWNTATRRCEAAVKGQLDDDAVAQYAYALAKAHRYEEALATLDMLENPNTARALNYRGYATRKLGRTEEGIGYYLQSVKLDPHYAQVREYLGEAYVIQGKLDLAHQQLDVIKSICGTGCEEYEDLAKALHAPSGL